MKRNKTVFLTIPQAVLPKLTDKAAFEFCETLSAILEQCIEHYLQQCRRYYETHGDLSNLIEEHDCRDYAYPF